VNIIFRTDTVLGFQTSPSHPMGFAELANFILNRHSLEEEFARIPQVTANVDELPEGADTKNRYANVIPLPETRVHLSPREGEPLSEYINANFVHVSIVLVTESSCLNALNAVYCPTMDLFKNTNV
jgi:protein tyrosine phosphatase